VQNSTVPVKKLPPEPIPDKLPGSRWMAKGPARVVKPPAQGLTCIKVTPKPVLVDTGLGLNPQADYKNLIFKEGFWGLDKNAQNENLRKATRATTTTTITTPLF
jgi:hypothetical protein